MINLNLTSMRDISTHIRHLLTIEEIQPIIEHGFEYCDTLDSCISKLILLPTGEELLLKEEKLWVALERFLEPIDLQVNVWIESMFITQGDFSDLGLDNEEGLCLDPQYKAAVSLLPHDETRRRNFINPGYGKGCGFVWSEPDLRLLIDVLTQPESKKHASILGIDSERVEVLLCWHGVEQAASSEELRGILSELRALRYGIEKLYVVLSMHLFPDCERHRKPRVVDPRTLVFPIQQEKRFQNLLMEFSINDLTHDQFETLIVNFWDNADPKMKGHLILDRMSEELSEYQNLLHPFRDHSSYETFLESEGSWYRNGEMIFLCMKFSVESPCADDREMWKKHEEGDQFQAAMELWDLLSTNGYESIWSLERGGVVHTDHWEEMVLEYSRPENRALLEEIHGLEYFDAAVEADVLSRQICETVHGDEDALRLLRFYRERLVAGYNVYEIIARDLTTGTE